MNITNESHLDHGLTENHLAWLRERFAGRDAFFLETVEIPPDLAPLQCGLHGPLVGDAPVPESECTRVVCGDRPGASRLCARAPRETRLVTVIAGPHEGEPCVLYTAFGGPSAPREPFDPSLDEFQIFESEMFWAEHALSEP